MNYDYRSEENLKLFLAAAQQRRRYHDNTVGILRVRPFFWQTFCILQLDLLCIFVLMHKQHRSTNRNSACHGTVDRSPAAKM